MKFYTKLALVGWPCVFALIWTAMATAEIEGNNESNGGATVESELKRAADEIHDRVGMAACLEESSAGDTAVEDAYAEGRIIEVTLEEVEAALAAAALTPEKEDDIEAMRLAHWGSYRFFLDNPAESGRAQESQVAENEE